MKDWTLVVAMASGAAAYAAYASLSLPMGVRLATRMVVELLQPLLIFAMLFITFCKVEPRGLRLRRWHLWLLAVQMGLFVLLAMVAMLLSEPGLVAVVEGAMLCFVCPTATAAAVVTQKLGGDAASLTTYTVLSGVAVAVAVPMIVPVLNPHPALGFLSSFYLILGKVLPVLIAPFFAALLVRWLMPRLHAAVVKCKGLAFYIWAFSLAIAIAVTVRSMAHSDVAWGYQLALAGASLAACVLQFWVGHAVGRRFGQSISAGQALGQKNTVFAIWMGYTFLTPVTSLAGGFYSVWHNVYNTWQLRQQQRAKKEG